MANEFVARNGIIALDNSTISGSLSVTNNISGSIFTGSFIGNLIGTSSQALTASFIQASGVVGLNLSQIATGSITASVNINSGSFNITSGSTNFFFVSRSGNIGINNITPSLLSGGTGLSISGSSYTQLQLRSSTAGIELIPSSGKAWEIQATNNVTNVNSFFVYNRTDNAYRFLIDGSGNIGVGTITPLALLHVSGTSGALLQTTNGSTTGLFVSSSGVIGIGTTQPSASLDVTSGGIIVRSGPATPPNNVNGLHFSFSSNIGYIQSVQIAGAGRQLEISGFPLIFKNSNSGVEAMRISTVNNISINKQANGNAPLDVSGSVLVSGSLAVSGSASITGSLGVTGSFKVTNLSGSGVRYLVADESGSVTAQSASAALKSTQAFTSTAGQTTFAAFGVEIDV